ncbi:unnamed protein product [Phaeothamnion confervicola]
MSTFEEARQILSAPGAAGGPSLYDHLSDVLLKVLTERPADAAEMFEHLSVEARASRVAEPAAPEAVPEAADATSAPSHGAVLGPAASAAKAARVKWAARAHAFFRQGRDGGEEDEADSGVTVPDMMDEAGLWEWAGVSLGRLETYRLYLSLKALARGLPAGHESLRFWGRITTRGGAYLVAEAKATDESNSELDPAIAEGTDGANRFAYWVSSAAGHAWELLPPVTAAQVVGARQLRRYLTGDLNAPVPGYPPFPGKERALLRAQIARIASATSVSPAGFFELDEESDPPAIRPAASETLAESYPKSPAELAAADAWCHYALELNARGRCRPPPPPPGADGDEDATDAEDADAPEEIPPLRALSEDADGSWGFRVGPGGSGASAASAVVAKSLLWPGAYAVACGRRFTTIYVGDGVKYLEAPFQPPPLPPVQAEWAPAEGEEPMLEADDILVDPHPPAAAGEDEE